MLNTLKPMPPDPLLGVTEAFRADPSPAKVDLGVGVYRDPSGITPVPRAVRAAEQKLLARQTSKAYVGAAGNRPFAAAMEKLALGERHPALRDGRVATLQSVGGTGALRLAAELMRLAGYEGAVQVSDPTWANHVPVMNGAGLPTAAYPYYDIAAGRVLTVRMLEALSACAPGTVVLLHGSCHNPTGADPDPGHWAELADLMARRRLVPFVDMAYQGLGRGLDADAAGLRLLAERLPELLVAVSCSKNFGLYRERVGAVMCIAENAPAAKVAMSHLQSLARRNYSMPPDHGAAIVAEIAGDPMLYADWQQELDAMRDRVNGLRKSLAGALRAEVGSSRFDFVEQQAGMFSMLGLPPAAVDQLRVEHHVYLAPDSRLNIAGLSGPEIPALARAVAAVCKG
jgi:aspartate/tyrosine/aromatic aminotransferase